MIVLNDEQRQIIETVNRFVTEQFSFDQRLQISENQDGFDRDHWRDFANLGLLGISFPEEHGGFGGSFVDVAIICQQLSKALMVSPYLTSIGTAGSVIMATGTDQQKTQYLGAISEGKKIITCAFSESDIPDDEPHTQAVRSTNEFVLNGCKRLVPFGAQADYVIVNAMLEREANLFIVSTRTNGIKVREYKMYDGSRCADIEFSDVVVSTDNRMIKCDTNTVQQIIDTETALLCAEASSMMWAIHDQTLEYLKIREQFGQTLSSMQALQHRIVDVHVTCQLAQSMAEDAIMSIVDGCDQNERMKRISEAKIYIAERGRQVGKEGVQLHGGIGMTNDIPIGHYLKRLTSISLLNGDQAWHRKRLQNLRAD